MRPLIVGSSGLVGSFLAKAFPFAATLARTPSENALQHTSVDIFDCSDFRFLDGISHILFLAFPTNLDEIESANPSTHQQLLDGFSRCVDAFKKRNLPVLFVSSEAVLATTPPEQRTDQALGADFLNHYARLKSRCESILLASTDGQSTVVRCTPVGFHVSKPNYGFVGSMWHRAQQPEGAHGFFNNLFTPVSNNRFALFCKRWIDSTHQKPPVVHLASQTKISKYDFLDRLFQTFAKTYHLKPIEMNPLAFKAKRCLDQSLVPSRLQSFDSFDIDEVITDLSQYSVKNKES